MINLSHVGIIQWRSLKKKSTKRSDLLMSESNSSIKLLFGCSSTTWWQAWINKAFIMPRAQSNRCIKIFILLNESALSQVIPQRIVIKSVLPLAMCKIKWARPHQHKLGNKSSYTFSLVHMARDSIAHFSKT